MNIDFTKIEVIEIEDIDFNDAPDFCDAFIAEALIEGREATDEELDIINENADFVYKAVTEYLY